MPRAIARIVRTFEGKDKTTKPSTKNSPNVNDAADAALDANKAAALADSQNSDNQGKKKYNPTITSTLSHVAQARLAIDQAIKNPNLAKHPATWYYRGAIYDRLLRDHIASEEATDLLNATLEAYEQVKKLSIPASQFHSFALRNLGALWRYFLSRGMGYYRQDIIDESLNQFTICQRILPQEATPWLYMAIVHHSNNQPREALRCYETYTKCKGAQFAVSRARASIYYQKLKDLDKAIAIINEALLAFPFNNELLEEKCLIYEAAKKMDAYKSDLAIGLKRKEINAYYAYAYLLEYQGATHEAIAYHQEILKTNPNQYNAARQLGFIFYNEAIKLCSHRPKSAKKNDPSSGDHFSNLLGLVSLRCTHGPTPSIRWSKHAALSSSSYSTTSLRASKLLPFIREQWTVHDHPLVKSNGLKFLEYLLQARSIPCTSFLYGYIHEKIATVLAYNKKLQTVLDLEQYLKKSVHFLKIAHEYDKKDKVVAQALYYSYYYLRKHASAYSLLQAMQKKKQYLEDDPFLEESEES